MEGETEEERSRLRHKALVSTFGEGPKTPNPRGALCPGIIFFLRSLELQGIQPFACASLSQICHPVPLVTHLPIFLDTLTFGFWPTVSHWIGQ